MTSGDIQDGFESFDAYMAALFEAFALHSNAWKPEDRNWPVKVSFANSIFSTSYAEVEFPCLESLARCATGGASHQVASSKEDCPVYTAGLLGGPNRTQGNVRALNLFIADYDKGHCTPAQLNDRLVELGLYGAAGPSFNFGATTHSVSWLVSTTNRKTGEFETKPSEFHDYCKGEPTDALAQKFAVDVEGYDATALGNVTLGALFTKTSKNASTSYYPLHHSPIPKTRAFVAIEPVLRRNSEAAFAFAKRWEGLYHGIARLIGVPYDGSCASLERCYYGFYQNENAIDLPDVQFSRGDVLKLNDVRLLPLISTANAVDGLPKVANRRKATPANPSKVEPTISPLALARSLMAEKAKSASSSNRELKWVGFRAADAAAHLWSDITDKRASHNLIAMDCPFLAEHATSNTPGKRQLAVFNPRTAAALPHCKCQADACSDRTSEEFLGELFTDEVLTNPLFRSK